MSDLGASPSLGGTVAVVSEPVRYAGFWIRALALLIDSAIIFPIAVVSLILQLIPMVAANPGLAPQSPAVDLAGNLLSVTVGLTYMIGLTASPWQATLGKRWLGICVQTTQGRRLRPWRVLGRELAKTLSTLLFMIGYLMAGWTREKTALHDLIAGTRVVHGRKGGFQQQAGGVLRPPRSPGTALIWSLVISGGGQFYNRKPLKGVAFLIAGMGLWTVWLGWIPWLWSISDAYDTANRQYATAQSVP